MKADPTRLAECVTTIQQHNGHSHIKHITSMTRKVPAILSSISLDVGAGKVLPGGPSEEQRQLIRAIALVEATRSGAAIAPARLNQLMKEKTSALKQALTALVSRDNQDAKGPVYVGPGEGNKFPTSWPKDWEPKEHFACHLDSKTIVAGPENPRTVLCGIAPAPAREIDFVNAASGHCRRAWELVRYYQVPKIDLVKLFAGGQHAPRFIAGMVISLNPLTFTDETGHFFMNYSVQAEHEFMKILKGLKRKARLVHFKAVSDEDGPGKCPSPVQGKCPGHDV